MNTKEHSIISIQSLALAAVLQACLSQSSLAWADQPAAEIKPTPDFTNCFLRPMKVHQNKPVTNAFFQLNGGPGGLVELTATVDPDAYIGVGSHVCGHATVGKGVRILGSSVVMDNAHIDGNVTIQKNAVVSERAFVHSESSSDTKGVLISDFSGVAGDSEVADQASVTGLAAIDGHAKIRENAWVSADQFPQLFTVGDFAIVKGLSQIMKNVTVSGHAMINGKSKNGFLLYLSDSVKISDYAQVEGTANLSGEVEVFDMALIADEVHLSDQVKVYGNSSIKQNAKLSGEVKIYGEQGSIINARDIVLTDSVDLENVRLLSKEIMFSGDVLWKNCLLVDLGPLDVRKRMQFQRATKHFREDEPNVCY